MNSDNNILHIDAFNGISGDMLISAFIDAGMPLDLVLTELEKIGLSKEIEVEIQQKTEFGLTGISLIIQQTPLKKRNYKDIVTILENYPLAKKILQTIAYAEAKIHNVDLNEVHFHEIGAIDTIFDCIGVGIGIDFFNIKEFYVSDIPLGKGYININHGIYPNPSPAVAEMLKSFRVKFVDINEELTTPTGAAIIKALDCKNFNNESVIINKVGYGFGNKKFKDRPNCLRIFIGKKIDENIDFNSKVVEINFNVDDMTGEQLGYFVEKAMEQNILDISILPTITKKNRPGYLVTILVNEITDNLLKFIFENTTTSGLRFIEKKRFILERYSEGEKKFFKSEKLKIKKWKYEFDKIIKGGRDDS